MKIDCTISYKLCTVSKSVFKNMETVRIFDIVCDKFIRKQCKHYINIANVILRLYGSKEHSEVKVQSSNVETASAHLNLVCI
jgi:hypothetical protein